MLEVGQKGDNLRQPHSRYLAEGRQKHPVSVRWHWAGSGVGGRTPTTKFCALMQLEKCRGHVGAVFWAREMLPCNVCVLCVCPLAAEQGNPSENSLCDPLGEHRAELGAHNITGVSHVSCNTLTF